MIIHNINNYIIPRNENTYNLDNTVPVPSIQNENSTITFNFLNEYPYKIYVSHKTYPNVKSDILNNYKVKINDINNNRKVLYNSIKKVIRDHPPSDGFILKTISNEYINNLFDNTPQTIQANSDISLQKYDTNTNDYKTVFNFRYNDNDSIVPFIKNLNECTVNNFNKLADNSGIFKNNLYGGNINLENKTFFILNDTHTWTLNMSMNNIVNIGLIGNNNNNYPLKASHKFIILYQDMFNIAFNYTDEIVITDRIYLGDEYIIINDKMVKNNTKSEDYLQGVDKIEIIFDSGSQNITNKNLLSLNFYDIIQITDINGIVIQFKNICYDKEQYKLYGNVYIELKNLSIGIDNDFYIEYSKKYRLYYQNNYIDIVNKYNHYYYENDVSYNKYTSDNANNKLKKYTTNFVTKDGNNIKIFNTHQIKTILIFNKNTTAIMKTSSGTVPNHYDVLSTDIYNYNLTNSLSNIRSTNYLGATNFGVTYNGEAVPTDLNESLVSNMINITDFEITIDNNLNLNVSGDIGYNQKYFIFLNPSSEPANSLILNKTINLDEFFIDGEMYSYDNSKNIFPRFNRYFIDSADQPNKYVYMDNNVISNIDKYLGINFGNIQLGMVIIENDSYIISNYKSFVINIPAKIKSSSFNKIFKGEGINLFDIHNGIFDSYTIIYSRHYYKGYLSHKDLSIDISEGNHSAIKKLYKFNKFTSLNVASPISITFDNAESVNLDYNGYMKDHVNRININGEQFDNNLNLNIDNFKNKSKIQIQSDITFFDISYGLNYTNYSLVDTIINIPNFKGELDVTLLLFNGETLIDISQHSWTDVSGILDKNSLIKFELDIYISKEGIEGGVQNTYNNLYIYDDISLNSIGNPVKKTFTKYQTGKYDLEKDNFLVRNNTYTHIKLSNTSNENIIIKDFYNYRRNITLEDISFTVINLDDKIIIVNNNQYDYLLLSCPLNTVISKSFNSKYEIITFSQVYPNYTCTIIDSVYYILDKTRQFTLYFYLLHEHNIISDVKIINVDEIDEISIS